MVDNWKNVIYGNTDYGQYALLPQDDYIKEFYDTGVQYSNTVTASAGSDKLTGRLSLQTVETMVLFLTTLSIDNTST